MIKSILIHLGISVCISLFVFMIKVPTLRAYLLLLSLFSSLSIPWYLKNKNTHKELFVNYYLLLAGNLIAYLLGTENQIEKLQNYVLWTPVTRYGTIQISMFCILAVWFAGLIALIIKLNLSAKCKKSSSEEDLFEEHVWDLQRLKVLLEKENLVGVDSAWGEGKSFVVDSYCREQEDNGAKIIKVETIAYSYKDFDKILLRKINDLLKNEYILSAYLYELLSGIEESALSNFILKYFMPAAYQGSSVFDGIRNDLEKLDSPVILVFEDLERITDIEIIKRIFAITERLASAKVKIIFEYNGAVLDEKGIDRPYREKYIVREMKLTKIEFAHLIDNLWNSFGMDQTSADKEEYKKLEYISHNSILPSTKLQITMDYRPAVFTPRRVENFLKESSTYLNVEPYKSQSDYRSAMLRFFFIKFFVHPAYELFSPHERLEDKLLFTVNKDKLRLKELCELLKSNKNPDELITQLFQDENNKLYYFIFSFLNYGTFDYQKDSSKPDGLGFRWQQVSTEIIARKAKFELKRNIIDYTIWHLLANGESEVEDQQGFMLEFKAKVLDESDPEKQKAAWNRLWNAYYYGNGHKTNRSIFHLGENYMLAIAKAIYSVDDRTATWKKFYLFYKREEPDFSINTNLVKMLDFINISNQNQALLEALHLFNEGTIKYNLDSNKPYIEFLCHTMRNLYRRGLLPETMISVFMVWCSNGMPEKLDVKNTIEELQTGMRNVDQELQSTGSSRRIDELTIIKSFLQKNLAIINNSMECEKIKSPIDIKFSSQYNHDSLMDSLIDILKDESIPESERKSELKKAAEKAYDEYKLDSYEFAVLMNKVNRE